MKWDKNIKTLLERYYSGETTLEEENYLYDVFTSGDVPDEFAAEKEMFGLLRSEKDKPLLNEDFDEKILNIINEKERAVSQKRTLYFILSGMAAAIVILLSVWLGKEIFTQKQIYGNVTDPKIAFAQTRNALNLISIEMNRGLKPVGKATGTLNKSFEKIDKPFNELQRLNKIERAVSLLQLLNGENSNSNKH
jgi:hypothetical protein